MNHKGRAVVPTRHTGFHQVSFMIIRNLISQVIDEFRAFWPWANKAHAAIQDIEDLWELI